MHGGHGKAASSRSMHGASAVDDDGLPGDEIAVGRCQVEQGADQIRRRFLAPDRARSSAHNSYPGKANALCEMRCHLWHPDVFVALYAILSFDITH